MSLRSEVRDFLEGVEHGGRSAGGQESVGHQIHGDEVGDALDERFSLPYSGERRPGFVCPSVFLIFFGSVPLCHILPAHFLVPLFIFYLEKKIIPVKRGKRGALLTLQMLFKRMRFV